MNKTIFITGSTSGIGLATSKLFYKKGYNVIGVSRKRPRSFFGEHIECDLMNKNEAIGVIDNISKSFSIDIIFNNFGVSFDHSFYSVTEEEFFTAYYVNVYLPLYVCQKLTLSMKKNSWGRIINNSSILSQGAINRSAYSCSKNALISLTKILSLELSSFNILANCLIPGYIDTPMLHAFSSEDKINNIQSKIPLRRLGRPEEVASFVLFLSSSHSSYITGESFIISGGL